MIYRLTMIRPLQRRFEDILEEVHIRHPIQLILSTIYIAALNKRKLKQFYQ
jgi:hypothetical protein